MFLVINGEYLKLTKNFLYVIGMYTACMSQYLDFELSFFSLRPFIVVPSSARDNTLDYVASLHHGNRLPVWCWSHPNTGVSLTRGGAPSIDDQSEAPDPK